MNGQSSGSLPHPESLQDQRESRAHPSAAVVRDPFCILVWRFSVEAGDAAAFAAKFEASTRSLGKQPKCLFLRADRNDSAFDLHVGLEDSYGVLTHVVSFADTLKKLAALGRYHGLEIHGTGSELALLQRPLERFQPLYVERAAEVLV